MVLEGGLGCGSPRDNKRSRRRVEMELRDDRDLVLAEEMGKPRKRRHSGKSKEKKLSLVPCLPSSSMSPSMCCFLFFFFFSCIVLLESLLITLLSFSLNGFEADDSERGNLDRIGEVVADLIMWRDVAKSSLWFGFGCLCFLSSCFTKGVTFR